jgi:hypothetical protein
MFVPLSEKTWEAIPLLRNARPDSGQFYDRHDILRNRLLDASIGVITTNICTFRGTASYGPIGLFSSNWISSNLSDAPDGHWRFNVILRQKIFTTSHNAQQGEELTHKYKGTQLVMPDV